MSWAIGFSRSAEKQLKKLPEDIQGAVALLVEDLKIRGPHVHEWKNFGKLKGQGERYHCHIKSGHPTYVACWEVLNKRIRILEINYVGTHEKAPY